LFRSKVPLDVYIRVEYAKASTYIGPAVPNKPIQIPACDDWWVSPAGVPLAEVVKEVQAQAIPGLRLPSATDEDLALLQSMKGLRALDLSGSAVTDDGLQHLEGFLELQELDLTKTQVTDNGLEHLKGL